MSASSLRSRLMSDSVDASVRTMAWAMLVAQSLIILTGALVRLTGSGLGCPTWPMCTDESLIPTGEMGVHGIIEYGNRMLGVALGILGVVLIVRLWPLRAERRDLFVLAVALFAVVPVQALIGGLSVLTQLNPWWVAAHFVPSAVAVAASAFLVRRTYDAGGRGRPIGTPLMRGLAWAIAVLTVIVVVFGVLTTGAGPHAGDDISARNDFDALLMSRLHAAPVWLLVASTVGLLLAARRAGEPTVVRAAALLLAVEVFQGVVGYVQFFTGLPWWLVAVHIVGICLVIAAATNVVDVHYHRPAISGEGRGAESSAARRPRESARA